MIVYSQHFCTKYLLLIFAKCIVLQNRTLHAFILVKNVYIKPKFFRLASEGIKFGLSITQFVGFLIKKVAVKCWHKYIAKNRSLKSFETILMNRVYCEKPSNIFLFYISFVSDFFSYVNIFQLRQPPVELQICN